MTEQKKNGPIGTMILGGMAATLIVMGLWLFISVVAPRPRERVDAVARDEVPA